MDQEPRPMSGHRLATEGSGGVGVSLSCQAEPQTLQLGEEGSTVTGQTAQQGADDSCYRGRLRQQQNPGELAAVLKHERLPEQLIRYNLFVSVFENEISFSSAL